MYPINLLVLINSKQVTHLAEEKQIETQTPPDHPRSFIRFSFWALLIIIYHDPPSIPFQ